MDDFRARISHLNIVIGIGFFIIGVGLVYWSAFQANEILPREDNPRLVDKETSIERGRILSTNNVVLAESVERDGVFERQYDPQSGGPALGYYSIRHGLSGIEESLDSVLRGELDNPWSDFISYELLHEKQVGRDVRLAIDERWQRAAKELLGEQEGAIILLSIPDNSIRVMSSHPTYDPNTLEDEFDFLAENDNAPLLNRTTQGQYTPGMIIQPLLLAYALDHELIKVNDQISNINRNIEVDGKLLTCAKETPDEELWSDVLAAVCPGPMFELGNRLGVEAIQDVFRTYGFFESPQLELLTAPAESVDGPIDNPGYAAIGLGDLVASPLQIILAFSSLANDGLLSDAKVVESIENEDNLMELFARTQEKTRVVSPETAATVLNMLPNNNGLTEHVAANFSATNGSLNSWYLAFAPASDPRYALIVVVENSSSQEDAIRIGRSLLRNVLALNQD